MIDPITLAVCTPLGAIAGYLVGRLGKAVLHRAVLELGLQIDDLSARNVALQAKLERLTDRDPATGRFVRREAA